jgi:argininosuccinate synthase
MKKVMLAYSGGLDTSVILKWLINKGYDVIAYVADVGQDEDYEAVQQKALAIGASKVIIEDLRREFVTEYIFKAIKANAVYEDRYLLGTALARPLIARKQIEAAIEYGADYVAHGATGKGNDQVRFELTYYALKPDIKVISPWKDPEFLSQFQGRSDMIRYAAGHRIPVKASISKPYSEDDNLMHISHEAGILEDPLYFAGKDILQKMVMPMDAPDREAHISVTFRDGIPVKVTNRDDGTVYTDPLELFTYLNRIGGQNGIGLLDMVENRFVGIKSRGIYETPGATILHAAHKDIEGIAMDREVMRLRNMLAPVFAELVYNGFWFSPEREMLQAAVDHSQAKVTGTVRLKLYKGSASVVGRKSPHSLYSEKVVTFEDDLGAYDQRDAEGFIKLNALRLRLLGRREGR